jgi:phosphoserine phosphatase
MTATGADGSVVVLPGLPTTADPAPVIDQMLRRTSSAGFGAWWQRAASVGFCAAPIQLAGTDPAGRRHTVWTRCNNRRAAVCPSCSDLYGRDTWQLVHAGAAGGHHHIPAAVAARPQVFATLTAPGYGAVHTATGTTCRRKSTRTGVRCAHGNPMRCGKTHDADDPAVGQPLCRQCYDYLGHVLFTWHLPELWRRFTIALRRAIAAELKAIGIKPGSVRSSFVKVVELQARAIPHIHALIRLDPPPDTAGRSGDGKFHCTVDHDSGWEPPIAAADLAALIQRAARQVSLDVTVPAADDPDQTSSRTVRFGTQLDTQPLTPEPTESQNRGAAGAGTSAGLSPRRVAGYLAKYVTKSLHDFGITARRLSAEIIDDLDITEHVRAILTTIAELGEHAASASASGSRSLAGIGRWLHTLGFRGHITTKSRRYSTTMGALRAARAAWTREQHTTHPAPQDETPPARRGESAGKQPRPVDADDEVLWDFDRAGHASAGDRVLIVSAALRHIHARITGLTETRAPGTQPVLPQPGAGYG